MLLLEFFQLFKLVSNLTQSSLLLDFSLDIGLIRLRAFSSRSWCSFLVCILRLHLYLRSLVSIAT